MVPSFLSSLTLLARLDILPPVSCPISLLTAPTYVVGDENRSPLSTAPNKKEPSSPRRTLTMSPTLARQLNVLLLVVAVPYPLRAIPCLGKSFDILVTMLPPKWWMHRRLMLPPLQCLGLGRAAGLSTPTNEVKS